MTTLVSSRTDGTLAELLGTFLQVSAPSAPASLSLRQAADSFCRWAQHQPVMRLDSAYVHLLSGQMDPPWDELGFSAASS